MRSLRSAGSIFGLATALCSCGCATIVKGRYQELTINSNPPGATFEVDGISGTTPGTVPLERKQKQHTVTISKPGYETAQLRIARQFNLWTAGNVIWGLFGMPVGIGVDLINGSAYRLATDTIQISLQPQQELVSGSQPMTGEGATASTSRHIPTEHLRPPLKAHLPAAN